MRKPAPVWPLFAVEWYSRWPLCKVVKHLSGILTSEILITSHTTLVSLWCSSSSYCMCSSRCSVLTLYVAIFSLHTLFRRFFPTHRFLAPLARILVYQSCLLSHGLWEIGKKLIILILRGRQQCMSTYNGYNAGLPQRTGGHDFLVLCMLILLAYPFTLTSAGWKG